MEPVRGLPTNAGFRNLVMLQARVQEINEGSSTYCRGGTTLDRYDCGTNVYF